MRRQGGGFGFVMLLVVVAVVLFLAARNWKRVAPTAMEVSGDPATELSTAASDSGQPNGGVPPVRPSLREMQQETSAHTDDVRDTLSKSD
jgi:hypothetical protein